MLVHLDTNEMVCHIGGSDGWVRVYAVQNDRCGFRLGTEHVSNHPKCIGRSRGVE
jgi:hypothetical protein